MFYQQIPWPGALSILLNGNDLEIECNDIYYRGLIQTITGLTSQFGSIVHLGSFLMLLSQCPDRLMQVFRTN